MLFDDCNCWGLKKSVAQTLRRDIRVWSAWCCFSWFRWRPPRKCFLASLHSGFLWRGSPGSRFWRSGWRAATVQLALHTGPTIGSLLTVSLGSLAELVLALFVLAHGQSDVVHAQITGSILGTCLLGLGLAIVVGGFTREHQTFKRERAGLLSSMLILAVIALLLPAVFDYTGRSIRHTADVAFSDEALSLAVSCVLLLLYAGNLVYTLVTHRDVFSSGEEERGKPEWSALTCLMILAAATAAAALESELVSGALTSAADTLHRSKHGSSASRSRGLVSRPWDSMNALKGYGSITWPIVRPDLRPVH